MFKTLLKFAQGLALSLTLITPMFGTVASASEGVTISVLELPHLFQKDRNGLYDQMMRALQREGLVKDWKILPYRTSDRYFEEKRVDCLAPYSEQSAAAHDGDYIFSNAFNYASGKILLPAGHPALKDYRKLDGLKVATVKIPELTTNQNVAMDAYPVKNYRLMTKMMMRGRIDAGYFMFPDVQADERALAYFKKHEKNAIKIWSAPEKIMCHSENKAIIRKINQFIRQYLNQNEALTAAP